MSLGWDQAYSYLLKNLSQEDVGAFKKNLEYLPIETGSSEVVDRILGILTDRVLISPHPRSFLEVLLQRWEGDTETISRGLGLVEGMFYNKYISLATLELTLEIYPQTTYYSIVFNIIENVYLGERGHDPLFGLIRLEKVFNIRRIPSIRSQLLHLIEYADQKSNLKIREYLKELIRKELPPVYAPKPDWIEEKTPPRPIPPIRVLKVDHLYQYLLEVVPDRFQVRNPTQIRESLVHLSITQRLDLYYSLIRSGALDPELTSEEVKRFHNFGPSNPRPGTNLEDYQEYQETMLRAPTYSGNQPPGREDLNTPPGSVRCWECPQFLPRKEYGLRIPLDTGGWLGWFCDRQCALKWIKEAYSWGEDQGRLPTIYRLIEKTLKDLRRYKIYLKTSEDG